MQQLQTHQSSLDQDTGYIDEMIQQQENNEHEQPQYDTGYQAHEKP